MDADIRTGLLLLCCVQLPGLCLGIWLGGRWAAVQAAGGVRAVIGRWIARIQARLED